MLVELVIENISKKYGEVYALRDVNIKLENGIYGLIGPNGAGKTTLIHIILGLLDSDQGRIMYDGTELKKYGDAFYNKVGYLPQYPQFYKNFTGEEFLLYMGALKGVKVDIEEIFRMVNLENDRTKKIGAYSGGMRQRLGIAQALLNNPEILILDEPTAGLDPAERIRFRNIISRLSSDRIVILATHIISDIEAIARKVILLNKGKVIVNDTPEHLVHTVENLVWEVEVGNEELEAYETTYQLTNIQVNENCFCVKLLAETPPNAMSKKARATLDDVFLLYFGGDYGNKK